MKRMSLLPVRKATALPEDNLVFLLESVKLVGKTATVKPPTQLLMEVDVPGDEGELTKTPVAKVSLGVAKLNFTAKYNVQGDTGSKPASSIRTALVAGLQTEEEDDTEVIVDLKAVGAKGEESELGSCSIRLERILATGSDVKSATIAVNDAKGVQVAELKYSTTVLAALQALERQVNKDLAESALKKATNDGQLLALDVSHISLADLPPKSRPAHAQLKVELVGVAGAAPVACPAVPLTDGAAEVDFHAAFPVPPGSQLRTAVEAARRKGTLKLKVVLEAIVKSKSDTIKSTKEIGSAEYDLTQTLKKMEAEDEEIQLDLKGTHKGVVGPRIGKLTVDLDVVRLISQLDQEAPSGGDAAEASPERETSKSKRSSIKVLDAADDALVAKLSVRLESVTLNEKGSTLPGDKGGKVAYVHVEVDMLDTEKEPMRTEAAKLSKKGATLHGALAFRKDYKATPGSKLALKYLEALEPSSTVP